MDSKRIYKRLKNGKGIEAFYQKSVDVTYTIRLDVKENSFQLHTFNFDGNDVFEEGSYKNEKIRLFEDLDKLIKTLDSEFPGLSIDV